MPDKRCRIQRCRARAKAHCHGHTPRRPAPLAPARSALALASVRRGLPHGRRLGHLQGRVPLQHRTRPTRLGHRSWCPRAFHRRRARACARHTPFVSARACAHRCCCDPSRPTPASPVWSPPQRCSTKAARLAPIVRRPPSRTTTGRWSSRMPSHRRSPCVTSWVARRGATNAARQPMTCGTCTPTIEPLLCGRVVVSRVNRHERITSNSLRKLIQKLATGFW